MSIWGSRGNLSAKPGRDGRYPILTVENLSAWYGELRALQGISFSANAGEVVSVIGANGAGKSTLLRAMTGMMNLGKTAHISGRIECQGRRLDRLKTEKIVEGGVTMVPEGRMLFSRMTVEENLLVGAYTPRARDGARDRLAGIYEFFPRLAERRGQSVSQMSGGEQQMVAIGRALMSRPKMILLDEPSMGLAPQLVEQIFEIVKQINEQEGVTILLAEQNTNIALRYAKFGYILESGRVVMEGEAEQLRNNEDVKEFYLGLGGEGRKSFRDVKHYRRRKRWIG